MIELGPITDKEQIKQFYSEINFEYNENSGVVVAKAREEHIGYCLYDFTKEKMVIKKIEPIGDIPLADGILRSTLHIAAERSVMDTYYEGEQLEALCEKLSFIKSKEDKSLKTDNLFKSCGSCSGNL